MTQPVISFMAVERVDSPCVNICSIDPDDGYCEGCARKLDEITRWTSMGAAERARVTAELEARRTR